MWYGPIGVYHWFWILPAVFMLLIATRLILAIVFFRRNPGWHYGLGHGCHGHGHGYGYGYGDGDFDPEAILKRRLASGAITEEEYRRLKETLAK